MTIKKIAVAIFLFMMASYCFADYGDPGSIQFNTPDKASQSTNCLRWKKRCIQQDDCRKREQRTCYRCIKPSQYGFHTYMRSLEQTTCNPDNAQYLTTMGYRCYQPYKTSACLEKVEHKVCRSVCVEYSY